MSILAEAFRDAGYASAQDRLHAILMDVARMSVAEWLEAAGAEKDPEADRQRRRLVQIAKDALGSNKRNWDGARDAFYKAVKNDAGLLWELFAPYRQQAVQLLMSKAAEELRELERQQRAEASEARGQTLHDNHGGRAPRFNNPVGTGLNVGDNLNRDARPDKSGMAAVAAVATLSMLDRFTVNGQPIGDVTAAEARRWAMAHRRNVRFVELLVANLPDDKPIRTFRTAEDANALYRQASQEVADAQ